MLDAKCSTVAHGSWIVGGRAQAEVGFLVPGVQSRSGAPNEMEASVNNACNACLTNETEVLGALVGAGPACDQTR